MTNAAQLYSQQMAAGLSSLAAVAGEQDEPHGLVLATSSAAVAAPTPAPATQVVNRVPIIWNWAPTASGTMSLSLFDFCDTIPRSGVDGAPFFSGTGSFSSNYRAFVQGISSSGAFGSLVAAASQAAIAPPPAATMTPPGWARVAVNGILEWRPVWSPQMSPDEWMATVVGSNPTPQTIDFDFSAPNPVAPAAPAGSLSSLDPLLGSAVTKVSITAKAWGRIPITPGDWYDDTLVSLAQEVPFPPWSPSLLFGPRGLLRYRISEFYAAYSPQLSMTVSNAVSAAVTDFVARTATFIFGGMQFAGGAPAVPPDLEAKVTPAAAGTTITSKAASPYPQIVAVIVSSP